jgi:F0F1-type ATP synthase membrane subunit b/b'
MSVLIGGAVSVMVGLIGLVLFWQDFFVLLRGAAPIFLLLGGALAIYVGFDELKDTIRESQEKEREELNKAKTELEKAKAEAEKYREELEKMKEKP